MKIRRVDIQNYRGIRKLSWKIPTSQKFVCLIGPGDSSKSTILDAINVALSDRYSLSIADTDFFNGDTTQPIIIRVAISELSDEVIHSDVFGFALNGIQNDGKLVHDPVDGTKPCIVVELKIEEDLEPAWSLYREGENDAHHTLRSGSRKKLGAFKVDDRIDPHLRWTRYSALGKITEDEHGAGSTLAQATRASRKAVRDSISDEMSKLTKAIRAQLQHFGSGSFPNLQPGLDTSLTSQSGILALFDENIPLTNFGLGSKRLASLAAQQMARSSKSIILIDEIETGLEPHRLVHLLHTLKNSREVDQIFLTTHSPVAVEQMDVGDFAITRRSPDGEVIVYNFPNDTGQMQSMLRSRPSCFLAAKVVIGEGKTEYGLLHALIRHWDGERQTTGLAPAAALGVTVADGGGGEQTGQRASKLRSAGYEVALFVDHDVEKADKFIEKAETDGAVVHRWQKPLCTETALCNELTTHALTELLQLAVTTRVNEVTVRNDLRAKAGLDVSGLAVQEWIDSGLCSLEAARNNIGVTAKDAGWFKTIPGGVALGSFIVTHLSELADSPVGKLLGEIEESIYAQDKAL